MGKKEINGLSQSIFESYSSQLLQVSKKIDQDIQSAAELIINNSGKVVVCGLGKSGLIGQKIVEDISFEGSGCAISMASASIMTDLIKGKNENEAKEIVEDFLGMIKENPELKSEYLQDDEKTKLMCLSGVKQYPMRVKCATLSWHTLVSAFEDKKEEVKTEN